MHDLGKGGGFARKAPCARVLQFHMCRTSGTSISRWERTKERKTVQKTDNYNIFTSLAILALGNMPR